MNKRLLVLVATVAFAGLMAGFASTTLAYPTQTVPCSGCHGGAGATVSTTLVSTAGTTATYDFSAPGATAVAVFDGSTKLFTITASSGEFAVTTGKTYTLYAVTGPTTSTGLGSTTVSPVAAPVDATAPVTTSDAVASYISSAAIKLTASDTGSGVAATYYRLDGAAQVAGTAISVTTLGAHTLEFWSVDVAGNVEAPNTASFTIAAPPTPDPTTTPVPLPTPDPTTTPAPIPSPDPSATPAPDSGDGGHWGEWRHEHSWRHHDRHDSERQTGSDATGAVQHAQELDD